MLEKGSMTGLGSAALGCYAVHAGFHFLNGRPEEMLWACHLGAAVVGLGLLSNSSTINGIGVLFLLMGTPLWLLDLANGGVFYPTSCFTHIGGLAIGLYGVRRMGIPPSTWWKAVVALVALILVSRLVTPPRANVNVAFSIYAGWEEVYPSYPVYISTMIVLAAGCFLLFEYLLRRWFVRAPAREGIA